MKNTLKVLAILMLLLVSSCGSLSPSQRYAREHSDREFKGWKEQNKKMDKEKKKKVKDHTKVRHTWDKN
jgi:hypothetical protein